MSEDQHLTKVLDNLREWSEEKGYDGDDRKN